MFTEMLFTQFKHTGTRQRIEALLSVVKRLEQRIEALERQMADLKASQRRS